MHFAFDSAAVRKSEKANIQAVADALSKDSSAKLLIEGHCDERGTEEYNRSLGERRALALREALAKLGVDPSRIRTISYGKDQSCGSRPRRIRLGEKPTRRICPVASQGGRLIVRKHLKP